MNILLFRYLPSMLRIQKEEKASKLIKFFIQEVDGTIGNATTIEEFVMCVQDFNIQMEKEFLDSYRHALLL